MSTTKIERAPPTPRRGPAQRQVQKSLKMRAAILEAATDYIAAHGYIRATLAVIARQAGVSRGAITYHYASKVDLAAAVIEHVYYKRMTDFLKRTKALTETQRVKENLAVEVLWESYDSLEYKAYLQLNVATLTDPDLLKVFVPTVQEQEAKWTAEVMNVFREWEENAEALWVTGDLLNAVLGGMLLNRHIWDQPRREATLRALVASIIVQLRDREIVLPTAEETQRFLPPKRQGART